MHLLTDENGLGVFDPQVMSGIWLINDETDALTIIPLPEHDYEICGTDADEIILAPLSIDELLDDEKMADRGYTTVYQWQRRHNTEIGYYTS